MKCKCYAVWHILHGFIGGSFLLTSYFTVLVLYKHLGPHCAYIVASCLPTQQQDSDSSDRNAVKPQKLLVWLMIHLSSIHIKHELKLCVSCQHRSTFWRHHQSKWNARLNSIYALNWIFPGLLPEILSLMNIINISELSWAS